MEKKNRITFVLVTVQILSLLCFAQNDNVQAELNYQKSEAFINSNGTASNTDDRPVVGVYAFTSEIPTDYGKAITEKVYETLINSKRFRVVDRTSIDAVQAELNYQKSGAFINSNGTAPQDSALPANFVVTGQIRQITVSERMNADGSIGGYRASLSFTLKIDEVATGASSQEQSFESKGAGQSLSPGRAVDGAIRSITPELEEYFANNFPVNAKLVKILQTENGEATSILILGGNSLGLKEGDKLDVQKIESIQGLPYTTEIGSVKITKIAGDNFSECSVKKGGKDILDNFNAAANLKCKLIRD
jgi:TolB-like protein